MTEVENLKYEIEIKPTSRLTVSGKWALFTMSPRHGKNTWELQGMKVISWNILITCLKARFSSKEAESRRLEVIEVEVLFN